MPYYIESSALVKLIIEESGSDPLGAWLTSVNGNAISSELTWTEVLRSVRRQTPDLIIRAEETLRTTTLLKLTTAMFEHAGMLVPPSLRSLDALHLACALSLGSALEGLVTYDKRLAEGALLLGIKTLSPA